ncbi:MAG TPA: alpha-hydroxy acid oxidase [Actinoplanes sp.]|nr:alpha-hydroxy acid oxidase [Actinoplanes sp.]
MAAALAGDLSRRLARAVNLAEVRAAASAALPRPVFDIVEGGHGDDLTVRANRAAFDRTSLRPRLLEDVTEVDPATTVLGRPTSMPVLVAPCSFARLCDPGAERSVARAAGAADVEYVVPGGASDPPEDVARDAPGSLWYQIYLKQDHGVNAELVGRVAAAGYRALCVTVDTPSQPYRETDVRNQMTIPVTITPRLVALGLRHPRWARHFVVGNRAAGFSLTAARSSVQRLADTIGALRPVRPADLAWLRSVWHGPLVVKGVLRPEDVDPLLDLGADALVVSNHGGRNLDTTPATLDVLPGVVEQVAGRAEVLLDGGVRRGSDVVKAVALGARAVLVGRPHLHGLAAGGEPGVRRVLELLRAELVQTLRFVGAPTVARIDRELVATGAEPSVEERAHVRR